jgi:hypothetical protein
MAGLPGIQIQRLRGRELTPGHSAPRRPLRRRGQSWVSRLGHTFAVRPEAAIAEMRVN